MILFIQFITWFIGSTTIFSALLFCSLDLLDKAEAKLKAKLRRNKKFMKWLED